MAGKQVQQQNTIDRNRRAGSKILPGTYIGEVMDNADTMQKAGRLWVFIPDFGGIKTDPSSWMPVSYASPFYGISQHAPPTSTGGGTAMGGYAGGPGQVDQRQQQQSQTGVTTYGFWAIAPDIGVRVLCTFVDGAESDGYWFAVIPTLAHGMVPANGAPDGKSPMMDFNPLDPAVPNTDDLSSIERQPYQPLIDQLTAQGIQEDPLRGPITSSSFRESPSRVFGISSQSTPDGPGHTFVMDDGGEDGKNKLIRIRTSAGNQITMHDDTGMIYMINAQGTGWLELSPSGQIDVFGAAGINMATNGDVNFHADNNINMHAGNCIKIVAMNGTKVMGGEELQLHGAQTMIEGVDSLHIHSCKEIMVTSFADIHMKAFNYFCLKGKCFYWNSCTAKEAEQVPPEKPQDVSGYQTTVARAPSKEPYKEHDSGQSQGAGAAPPTAPDGSASATGAGGMFDGGAGAGGSESTNNTSFSGGPASSTAISQAIAGNSGSIQAGANTNVGIVASNSSNYGIGGVTRTPTAPTNSLSSAVKVANPSGTGPGGAFGGATAASTSTTTTNMALSNSGQLVSYYPGQQYGGYNGIPSGVTSGTLVTESMYGGYSGIPESTQLNMLSGAKGNDRQQPAGVFGSQNPADMAATTPAQDASSALGQMAGQQASTDLPAAMGGGNTDCFATGNNCERPVDQTGGAMGPGATDGRGLPGEPMSPEEEAKMVEQMKADAAAKGITLTDEDIANLKSVYAGEGYGGVITAMNRAQMSGQSVTSSILNGGYVGYRGPNYNPMTTGFAQEYSDWNSGKYAGAAYILSPNYYGGTPYNNSGQLNPGFTVVRPSNKVTDGNVIIKGPWP